MTTHTRLKLRRMQYVNPAILVVIRVVKVKNTRFESYLTGESSNFDQSREIQTTRFEFLLTGKSSVF